MHIAWRSDDVPASFAALEALGLQGLREPNRLEPAKADTALLCDATGFQVQVIRYDNDSPDLMERC